MTTNEQYGTTLSGEISSLISHGPDASDAAVKSLRALLGKFTTTADSDPSVQALQQLATVVGTQSRYGRFASGSG
jgi:hypothetical protein